MTPEEATSLGAKILTEHLNLFIGLTEHVNDVEIMVEKEEDKRKGIRDDRRRTRSISSKL